MVSMAVFCSLNNKNFMASIFLLGFLIAALLEITGAQSIGVCYGGSTANANNLPPEEEAINLYKSNGIGRMRIYDPNQKVLQGLKGSNIELVIGVANPNLQAIASDASAATQWVQNNVINYLSDVKFRYIAVGNEVQPSDTEAKYVLSALRNIYSAVASAGLRDQIKVSTVIDMRLLANTYPPSQGSFNDSATPYINPIIGFLAENRAPVLADVYPYFSYFYNTKDISLSYALFTSPTTVVKDQYNGLEYKNLFDALVDALYSAVEKAGGSGLDIVITESGWPSEGSTAATLENAGTYYKNLIDHVKGGTPKKPGKAIETYLFEMFDENQKKGEETERHFGVFYADKRPKYQLSFT